MPRLILIIGPQACGKMTIAQKMSRKFKLGMIHNHMIIDMMKNLYGYGSNKYYLERINITHEILMSSKRHERSMILTKTMNFGDRKDVDYFDSIVNTTRLNSIDLSLIELSSNLNIRLVRNKTRNRLYHKPSKRNVTRSERRMLQTENLFTYLIPEEKKASLYHRHIDNSTLTVEESVLQIAAFVGLSPQT